MQCLETRDETFPSINSFRGWSKRRQSLGCSSKHEEHWIPQPLCCPLELTALPRCIQKALAAAPDTPNARLKRCACSRAEAEAKLQELSNTLPLRACSKTSDIQPLPEKLEKEREGDALSLLLQEPQAAALVLTHQWCKKEIIWPGELGVLGTCCRLMPV